MTLKDYQEKAMATCLESSNNFSYMMLNLEGVIVNGNKCQELSNEDWREFDKELQKEAGDILWQLSGLCSVMGWSLEDIAQMNLDKLSARKAVGTIDGNGDGIIRGK